MLCQIQNVGPRPECAYRNTLSACTCRLSQILHVNVCAKPDVVSEVPPDMVGVVVDHDLVTVPEPIIHEAVVVRSHTEKEAAKAESLRTTATEPVYMAGSNTTAEVAVFPRMIKVIMGIVPARVVSNPRVVTVNVRSVGVPMLITVISRLGRLVYLLPSMCRLCMYRGARRGRSVCGDMLLAHAWRAALLGVPLFMLLSIQGTCRQQEKCCCKSERDCVSCSRHSCLQNLGEQLLCQPSVRKPASERPCLGPDRASVPADREHRRSRYP